MKILLVNGSPHERGCTHVALTQIATTLTEDGIDSEIFHLGAKAISGCRDCRKCAQLERCVINDRVNDFIKLAQNADGFVFGSPVHYAAAGGAMASFMSRAFFSASQSGRSKIFRLKPAAAVVSARRAGTTAALDQLNKYFTISEMPIVSSIYWNMVHGFTPDDVRQDLEGLQIMRVLARNMAWFLKCKLAGHKAGVEEPREEERIFTNFIR
ncbi:MAG: flavodoxin family protein [Deltaproteobacteria bacterium]|jgi:multimeric flavodoxin WrbA|nr:flavodoxin family protein [Deltaproteobacteria bacterium]